MNLKIKHIVLYPKNNKLKPRVLTFREDVVNVITGYSQRGKSAIIHIIDYCLGSTDCNIPIGKIRDMVAIFAINIKIGDRFMFIGRKNPIGGENSEVYYEVYDNDESRTFSFDRWIDNSEAFVTNRDDIKDFLGTLAGFENFSEKGDNSSSGFDAPASFRDTTAFQFQPQNIIANPTTIFYKTDSFEHLKRLKTLFPLVLGYKSYDILRLEKEIETMERQEVDLTKKIKDIKWQYENWQSDIFKYYTTAVALGLTERGLDISTALVDAIKDELVRIIDEAKAGNFFKTGSSLRYAKNLEELDEARLGLLRNLDEQKLGLTKIEQFDRTKEQYLDKVVREVENRLSPVDWWLDQEGSNTCPFCKSESQEAIRDLLRLKDVQIYNRQALGESTNKSYSFENEKLSYRIKIKEFEQNLKSVEDNIDILLNENRQYYKQYQDIYEFIGRVENVIENINKISPTGELSKMLDKIIGEIAIKKRELRTLKSKFDKDASLNQLSLSIGNYIKILPIEERDFRRVKLDPDYSVSIKIEDMKSGTSSLLSKIGSGANHMGYHIATLLGLHEYFIKLPDSGRKNYIPSFLILDQPSQVYFPEGYEKRIGNDSNDIINESLSEDIKNTTAIFRACSEFLKRTKYQTQIIIIEHAPSSTWTDVEHIHLVEEWRGDKNDPNSGFKALIPNDWFQVDLS